LALQPAKEARLDLPKPGLRRRQDPDWLCHYDDAPSGQRRAVLELLSVQGWAKVAFAPDLFREVFGPV
jgi:hypothetical protein